MKIFLTGGSGFLGNNLARMLLQEKHELTVSVREGVDLDPFKRLDVQYRNLDLSKCRDVDSVIAGADLIIHSAAQIQIGWSQLESSRRVNVSGTRALAKAANDQNMRMVYVSTVDALAAATPDAIANESDRTPSKCNCSYVLSKREAESAFQREIENGLDGVIVNPGFMVGPWDWKPSSGQMMLALANQYLPFSPSGGCSVVDVRDVAAGVIAAGEKGIRGERYILGGHNVTYFQLWNWMAEIIDSRPPIGTLPKLLERLMGHCGDLAGQLLSHEPQINSAATQLGGQLSWYSSEKATDELDYQITDPLKALSDAWTWFKEYGYV